MTRAAVRAGVGRSMERLGVATVDLMQFHWWSFAHPAYLDAMREMAAMKDEGLIRALGVTNFDTDHLRVLVGMGVPVATNQVSFSLVDRGAREDLTFDHVIPRSKGGQTTWENVVAACSPCNLRKGDRLPHAAEMLPRQAPYAPSLNDLHQNGRHFPPNYLHDSWMDYLYWDTELEP